MGASAGLAGRTRRAGAAARGGRGMAAGVGRGRGGDRVGCNIFLMILNYSRNIMWISLQRNFIQD